MKCAFYFCSFDFQAMHAAPMYIAETAPFQIRGRLISLKEFFIVLGMLVSVSNITIRTFEFTKPAGLD